MFLLGMGTGVATSENIIFSDHKVEITFNLDHLWQSVSFLGGFMHFIVCLFGFFLSK